MNHSVRKKNVISHKMWIDLWANSRIILRISQETVNISVGSKDKLENKLSKLVESFGKVARRGRRKGKGRVPSILFLPLPSSLPYPCLHLLPTPTSIWLCCPLPEVLPSPLLRPSSLFPPLLRPSPSSPSLKTSPLPRLSQFPRFTATPRPQKPPRASKAYSAPHPASN